MAFKINKSKIDLNIDFSDLLENENIKNAVDSEGILKPNRPPNGENIIKWTAVIKENEKNKDEIETNPEMATKLIVKQIDFWYNRGDEFWLKNIDFVYLKELLSNINNEIFTLKKK